MQTLRRIVTLTLLVIAGVLVATVTMAQDDGTPQYSYTFTAPSGSTSCQNYNANNQSAYTPENCSILNGFVSPDALYQASYTIGSSIQWLRIRNSAGEQQDVETTGLVWTGPTGSLSPGVPYQFSLTAAITTVCTAPSFICQAASGQLNIDGQWSYEWVLKHAPPTCKVGCTKTIRVWTTTSDLALQGLSTVAILD